ncbi:glycogen synthase kinase binding protein [Antennarius striatus]|uniref:glycogen synthase kinase binding protein n=1 Tax=Antennarius striatus TaxID=241820 RepID=UPI0035B13BAE
MPRRKDNYLFLERAVTADPSDVDALVTRIGEALQLTGNTGGHASAVSVSCLHGLTGGPGGVKPVLGGGTGAHRSRGHRGGGRPSPYSLPRATDRDWEPLKPWNRKRLPAEEDDPHRLLQELVLSGNLIKEAVRRLQFSADRGDFTDTPRVSC